MNKFSPSALLVLAILEPIAAVHGQSAAAPAPAFEVASIKPHDPSDHRIGLRFLPGGTLKAVGAPVQALIAAAYNVPFQSNRVSGGPDWIRSDEAAYDIDAKAAEGVIRPGMPDNIRQEKTRAMLQTLLAERFHLKIRREMKEVPVYAVIVAKNGPKLQQASVQEKDCAAAGASGGIACHQINGGMGRGIDGKAVDLSDVALFVSNWSDRPVIDKTGLQGLFEIKTDGWAPMRPRPPRPDGQLSAEDQALADPGRPTLFAIFERLGLRMEAQKAPVEMFVIEHVEKPSEN